LAGRIRAVTIQSYCKRVWLLSKLGDVENPEEIKRLICMAKVSEARKGLYTNAYDYYVQFRGLSWTKPKFTRIDVPIYVPLESELDSLIANSKLRLSTFLQLLKETGVDSGEAWLLKWTDLDPIRKTVSITPTKNHDARVLPISDNLMARLMQLHRVNERVFGAKSLDDFRTNFGRTRNRLADKLQNPRLRQIAFKSFRHWFATMQYHRTKDILHVKWLLGHKRIENTLVYTHLVQFESDEFVCRMAKDAHEASKLIEVGFEYVTEIDGQRLFRKRK
jgi:integrase